MPKPTNKPKLQLSGESDNAFAILGAAKKAARRADWTDEQFEEFKAEATSGDYDHLLQTCMKWFDVD